MTAWNTTTNPVGVNVKIYIRCPAPVGDIRLVNLSNVILPSGLTYGPATLINYFISAPLPTGDYSYEGRFLDVITGKILKQDIAPFTY